MHKYSLLEMCWPIMHSTGRFRDKWSERFGLAWSRIIQNVRIFFWIMLKITGLLVGVGFPYMLHTTSYIHEPILHGTAWPSEPGISIILCILDRDLCSARLSTTRQYLSIIDASSYGMVWMNWYAIDPVTGFFQFRLWQQRSFID